MMQAMPSAARTVAAIWAALGSLVFLAACDGASEFSVDGGPVATDNDALSDGGVTDAAAPPGPAVYIGKLPDTNLRYRILRGHGGAPATAAQLAAETAAAVAICLGEIHTDDNYHAVQLMLTRDLSAAATAANRPLALGMEMFQKRFQSVLDDFAAGTIDESTLLSMAQYKQRWGYDFSFYRPTIAVAVTAKQSLLALNAASELVKTVGRDGLAGLTPEDRADVPALDLTNDAHREWFRNALGSSAPAGAQAFDNFYAAQVIWDTTMAEAAWKWATAMGGNGPKRQVVILAGTGHCIDLGIPLRLRQRGVNSIVSVKPVYDRAPDLADAIREGLSDFLLVIAPQ